MTTDTPVPGASSLIAPGEMTREAALERLDVLKADPKWVENFSKGDKDAMTEHAGLIKAATAITLSDVAAQADARTMQQREQEVANYQARADLPPEVLDMVLKNTPVAESERQRVENEKTRLMQDRDFVRKWFDNDRGAKTKMALIDLVMSRPIIAGV